MGLAQLGRRDMGVIVRTASMLAALGLLTQVRAASADDGVVAVQGYLTGDSGDPVVGTHRLTFILYDDPETGSAQYTDDYRAVELEDGLFALELGSQPSSALDLGLFAAHSALWLEVVVDGSDVISPRTRLAPVPYAAHALQCGAAQTLGDAPASDYVTQAQLTAANYASQADLADHAAAADSKYVSRTGSDATPDCASRLARYEATCIAHAVKGGYQNVATVSPASSPATGSNGHAICNSYVGNNDITNWSCIAVPYVYDRSYRAGADVRPTWSDCGTNRGGDFDHYEWFNLEDCTGVMMACCVHN